MKNLIRDASRSDDNSYKFKNAVVFAYKMDLYINYDSVSDEIKILREYERFGKPVFKNIDIVFSKVKQILDAFYFKRTFINALESYYSNDFAFSENEIKHISFNNKSIDLAFPYNCRTQRCADFINFVNDVLKGNGPDYVHEQLLRNYSLDFKVKIEIDPNFSKDLTYNQILMLPFEKHTDLNVLSRTNTYTVDQDIIDQLKNVKLEKAEIYIYDLKKIKNQKLSDCLINRLEYIKYDGEIVCFFRNFVTVGSTKRLMSIISQKKYNEFQSYLKIVIAGLDSGIDYYDDDSINLNSVAELIDFNEI